MKLKAVLFDIDGTIISLDAVVSALRMTCKDWGLRKLTEKEIYTEIIGWKLPDVFEKFFPKYAKRAKEFDIDYHNNYVKHCHPRLLPHVKKVLGALKKGKLKIGFVTTKARITALHCLRENRLPYNVLVSADDVRNPKPSPEPVLKAMKTLHAAKKETIMIGDHTFDVMAGKGAGCTAVGITTGVKTRKELKRAGADYVINDLEELLEIIKSPDV